MMMMMMSDGQHSILYSFQMLLCSNFYYENLGKLDMDRSRGDARQPLEFGNKVSCYFGQIMSLRIDGISIELN